MPSACSPLRQPTAPATPAAGSRRTGRGRRFSRRLKPPVPPLAPPARPQFEQILGRGAFKVVYKAFDTQEGASRVPACPASAGRLAPLSHSFCSLAPAFSSCLRAQPPPNPAAALTLPHRAGTEVAWNQVRVSEVMSAKDAENKEERDRLFAEIRVLKALKHKNIMSFYDSWYDPKTYTVNFITELFTSGTLRQ